MLEQFSIAPSGISSLFIRNQGLAALKGLPEEL